MRETSAKTWRQVGYWGMTTFVCIGPLLIWQQGNDSAQLLLAYQSNLAAWCVAAGIRQWGKNEGSER